MVFLLRISMGWIFIYAAYRQIPDPEWSAGGFLSNATTLPGFFSFFASPEILPIIDMVIPWAHLLIGLGLLLGLGMRLACFGGALLMFLYYLPRLDGFMVGANSFLIEFHLVYVLILIYLFTAHAGRVFGLEGFISRYPTLYSRLKRNLLTRYLVS
jgi:thiosulfate dehydrogenase (quinone) large subunit